MHIEILETQHIKDAATLIAQSFVNSEPLVSGLQIPFASFNKMCEEMVSQAASQSMSFVAIENFQMIGVLLIRKVTQPLIDKEKATEICPQMDSIFQLLDALEVNSIEFSHLHKENLVYLDMGACHPDRMGNGVVTALISHAMQEIALKRNFDIVAACTNKISQQLLKKRYNPFQINEIIYSDFLYQGKHPFSSITSSLTAQLLYIPQSQLIIKAI